MQGEIPVIAEVVPGSSKKRLPHETQGVQIKNGSATNFVGEGLAPPVKAVLIKLSGGTSPSPAVEGFFSRLIHFCFNEAEPIF